ncbi:MAG: hypothetical protein ETSY2_11385 [Candidatus Entotheonella gemina]|uniref:Microcin J25-processing protein McjB C-terminal domain-containing protein n=2 Tax=Candidatus Entotheonella TaxID=93171 RepID=W4MB37_9BACT|nr:MAG: hypothetical protein ETSY2_11385 [Candidatus Entotheonella gemina]
MVIGSAVVLCYKDPMLTFDSPSQGFRYMTSRRQQLFHFWQHPWADKWLFVQAYFGLGLAWMVIHTLPFRWIAVRLGECMGNSPDTISPEQARVARRVSWAVRRASHLTPWPSVCLPQAITAKVLLRRHGITSTLYLGAAFNESKALMAHAWLRCGSFYVTGGPGHEHYGVVASFAEKE